MAEALEDSRLAVRWTLAVATLFATTALNGQISSEGAIQGRSLPVAEQVKVETERVRFRLGPVGLLPFLNISELGYNSNVNGASTDVVSDWTAKVSAGTRFILPAGSKMYLRGSVAPEYNWYLDSINRRYLGGSYDARLLGLFNRLTIEAGGGQSATSGGLSSESQQAVVEKRTTGGVALEVEILRRLAVFAGLKGGRSDYTDSDSNPALSATALNRTEYALNGGLRYKFNEAFSFGVMVERTAADYPADPLARNNESTGYLLTVRYDRPRFFLLLGGGYREGQGRDSRSDYPSYSTGTYNYFASYFITKSLELQVLGHRRPVDSLDAANPYFFETRNALGLGLALGHRVSLRGQAEIGTNDYPIGTITSSSGEAMRRSDDFVTLTGQVGVRLHRSVLLTLNASNERATSNAPNSDRSVFRYWTGLSFGGDWTR